MKHKKPRKIVYENQKEVLKSFIDYINPKLKKAPEIKKALLWGSLINGSFGVYTKIYRNHEASDIDLIIFLDSGKKVPSHFKKLGLSELWFDLYKTNNFRRFSFDNNIHKIDLLVVKEGYNETFVRKRIKSLNKGKVKKIYLK